jgi:hypothetical protein
LSKAANCLFTRAVNKRLEAEGATHVIAVVVDPGLACTGVNFQHDLTSSMLGLASGFTRVMHNVAGYAQTKYPFVFHWTKCPLFFHWIIKPSTWGGPFAKAAALLTRHHAADGALPMVLAAIDPHAQRNNWYSPEKGSVYGYVLFCIDCSLPFYVLPTLIYVSIEIHTKLSYQDGSEVSRQAHVRSSQRQSVSRGHGGIILDAGKNTKKESTLLCAARMYMEKCRFLFSLATLI